MTKEALNNNLRLSKLDPYNDIVSSIFEHDTECIEKIFINAAKEGDLAKCELILQKRSEVLFNINAKDRTTGNTALIWAAKQNQGMIVNLLVCNGVDTTVVNHSGQTALSVAFPQIRQILLENVDQGSTHHTLCQAAWQGNSQLLKKLLTNNKLNVNCKNADGLSPLLLATRDVDLFQKISKQTLDCVRFEYSSSDAISQLLDNNVDVTCMDGVSNRTALHYICLNKTSTACEIVQKLLKAGAEIDAKDVSCLTPLHYASKVGNAEVVIVLLTSGANPNAVDSCGSAPLHFSVKNGHDSVTFALLSHGANVTMVDDCGSTPLDFAKSKTLRSTLKQAWMSQKKVDVESPSVEEKEIASPTTSVEECRTTLSGNSAMKFSASNGVGYSRHLNQSEENVRSPRSQSNSATDQNTENAKRRNDARGMAKMPTARSPVGGRKKPVVMSSGQPKKKAIDNVENAGKPDELSPNGFLPSIIFATEVSESPNNLTEDKGSTLEDEKGLTLEDLFPDLLARNAKVFPLMVFSNQGKMPKNSSCPVMRDLSTFTTTSKENRILKNISTQNLASTFKSCLNQSNDKSPGDVSLLEVESSTSEILEGNRCGIVFKSVLRNGDFNIDQTRVHKSNDSGFPDDTQANSNFNSVSSSDSSNSLNSPNDVITRKNQGLEKPKLESIQSFNETSSQESKSESSDAQGTSVNKTKTSADGQKTSVGKNESPAEQDFDAVDGPAIKTYFSRSISQPEQVNSPLINENDIDKQMKIINLSNNNGAQGAQQSGQIDEERRLKMVKSFNTISNFKNKGKVEAVTSSHLPLKSSKMCDNALKTGPKITNIVVKSVDDAVSVIHDTYDSLAVDVTSCKETHITEQNIVKKNIPDNKGKQTLKKVVENPNKNRPRSTSCDPASVRSVSKKISNKDRAKTEVEKSETGLPVNLLENRVTRDTPRKNIVDMLIISPRNTDLKTPDSNDSVALNLGDESKPEPAPRTNRVLSKAKAGSSQVGQKTTANKIQKPILNKSHSMDSSVRVERDASNLSDRNHKVSLDSAVVISQSTFSKPPSNKQVVISKTIEQCLLSPKVKSHSKTPDGSHTTSLDLKSSNEVSTAVPKDLNSSHETGISEAIPEKRDCQTITSLNTSQNKQEGRTYFVQIKKEAAMRKMKRGPHQASTFRKNSVIGLEEIKELNDTIGVGSVDAENLHADGKTCSVVNMNMCQKDMVPVTSSCLSPSMDQVITDIALDVRNEEAEHSGPVIMDPFESLRLKRETQTTTVIKPLSKSKSNADQKNPSQAASKQTKASKSRHGSAQKAHRSSKLVATPVSLSIQIPDPDCFAITAGPTTKEKNFRKKKSKSFIAKDSAQAEPIEIIDQNVCLIGGIGWQVATRASCNSSPISSSHYHHYHHDDDGDDATLHSQMRGSSRKSFISRKVSDFFKSIDRVSEDEKIEFSIDREELRSRLSGNSEMEQKIPDNEYDVEFVIPTRSTSSNSVIQTDEKTTYLSEEGQGSNFDLKSKKVKANDAYLETNSSAGNKIGKSRVDSGIEKLMNVVKNMSLKVANDGAAVSAKISDTSRIDQMRQSLIDRSLRFVRKHDSFTQLPNFENLNNYDDSMLTYVTTTDTEPSVLINNKHQAKMVTSRLGRVQSRVESAVSNHSTVSVQDDLDVIQWKRGNVLGKGAYGTVWCGLTNHGELIAVKMIELNTSNLQRAEKEYEQIQEEVDLLKTLKHENIVGYLGTSLEDNIVSIFMQFVPGGSIASILARFGALDEEVFCNYTKQILEGVEYLHSNNIIHRDIKGGNLMLMHNGIIKLIDFGCAKKLCLNIGSSVSHDMTLLLRSMRGTPYWMAPEVVKEEGHGTQSDIWSDFSPAEAIFLIGNNSTPIPQLPNKFSSQAKKFTNACMTCDPANRPSATQLLSHSFIRRRLRTAKSQPLLT